MDFQSFLTFAEEVEPSFVDIKEASFVKRAYDYAFKYSQNARFYLQEFQLEAYCYNLALHLIVLTPLAENPLFLKYFPADSKNERLKNYAGIIGSVSDSTSSISNMAFDGLNNLSIGDSMLLKTPYGAFIKSLNESFKNVIAVM